MGHFLSLLFFENAYCFACILKKLFVLVSAGCMFHCGVLKFPPPQKGRLSKMTVHKSKIGNGNGVGSDRKKQRKCIVEYLVATLKFCHELLLVLAICFDYWIPR